jgi:uncharacterized protein (DUF1778 family)
MNLERRNLENKKAGSPIDEDGKITSQQWTEEDEKRLTELMEELKVQRDLLEKEGIWSTPCTPEEAEKIVNRIVKIPKLLFAQNHLTEDEQKELMKSIVRSNDEKMVPLDFEKLLKLFKLCPENKIIRELKSNWKTMQQKDQKDDVIHIRVSKAEKEKIQRNAGKQNVSEYLRELALKHDDDETLIDQAIKKCQNNVSRAMVEDIFYFCKKIYEERDDLFSMRSRAKRLFDALDNEVFPR